MKAKTSASVTEMITEKSAQMGLSKIKTMTPKMAWRVCLRSLPVLSAYTPNPVGFAMAFRIT